MSDGDVGQRREVWVLGRWLERERALLRAAASSSLQAMLRVAMPAKCGEARVFVKGRNQHEGHSESATRRSTVKSTRNYLLPPRKEKKQSKLSLPPHWREAGESSLRPTVATISSRRRAAATAALMHW
jgi:hypothetical protein